MPGLDPQVAWHSLNIISDNKPVKQQQRQFQPDIMEAIKAKVHKLIEYGFIREEQHLDWVANIVHVLNVIPKAISPSFDDNKPYVVM